VVEAYPAKLERALRGRGWDVSVSNHDRLAEPVQISFQPWHRILHLYSTRYGHSADKTFAWK
jgi:hypothetical protein